MQSIHFTRDMSSVQVEMKIKSVFNLIDYCVLESDGSGHTLCKCSDQDLTGENVVGRKGCLYLCKELSQVRKCEFTVATQIFGPLYWCLVCVYLMIILQDSDSECDIELHVPQMKKSKAAPEVAKILCRHI